MQVKKFFLCMRDSKRWSNKMNILYFIQLLSFILHIAFNRILCCTLNSIIWMRIACLIFNAWIYSAFLIQSLFAIYMHHIILQKGNFLLLFYTSYTLSRTFATLLFVMTVRIGKEIERKLCAKLIAKLFSVLKEIKII